MALDNKTMIFGDVKTFAIEVHADPSPIGASVFGRMAVHLAGHTIGDLTEEHCGIGGPAETLREKSNCFSTLWDASFEGLEDVDVFHLLNNALYIDSGQSDLRVAEDSARYRRYDFLTGAGEQFDRVKSFCIRDAAGMACVLFQVHDQPIESARCSESEFRSAVSSFMAWLDSQDRPRSGVQQTVAADRPKTGSG
jgi:hypothetical protein